ncbi:AAA family ATPase [Aliarcobacter butzleri]|uniref:AAA family ATPase n=1 Tax=Aliarcobacter butzleri TaxID=28197 RepID=UPI00263C8096|nr:AAA family ATPase [Aliarcobacter butzleri]MDN5094329.1 AAA family ATPase [Aliarcobacter butzleri]
MKELEMYISKVSLINYRNFRNNKFLFNNNINTIIGENGSGKTNLFRAIRLLLDDNLLKYSYKLDESDFCRGLGDWRGHWIIISLEFSELSNDEAIQSLFIHGTGNVGITVNKASYNLYFRPKAEIRLKLSELETGDINGFNAIKENITINDYETYFTGKSNVDFNDSDIYKELVGDFENIKFNYDIDEEKFGVRIPHQLSISKEISFTFIKALRDVISDFQSNKTNPLLSLLKNKSDEISSSEFTPIMNSIKSVNEQIEALTDIQTIRNDIQNTISEAVGETYAPSSLSIKSNLSDEADKLLQSLELFISEPNEGHEGAIHELSLGGANLIFLTLKILEYKYRKDMEKFANFLLIEEPEAHIHTHIQKTLFQNLDYKDTQIIYSTHSTHISEVSKISNMNILSKKENGAESYQPSNGLPPEKILKLERYLDAIRSNLLFAKSVMLVEGDAESILIPNLIKKVLGISLDELGISLINIGSTGFENVAQIFHEDRIKRRCAIITDLDTAIADTTILTNDSDKEKKYKKKMFLSQKKGLERKTALDTFTSGNTWINVFYATHTFEIDFIEAKNINEVIKLCEVVYSDQDTLETSKNDIQSGTVSIYGKRILTMANNQGKGWFSILLSGELTFKTKIPKYILDSLLFLGAISNKNILINIISHRINNYKKENNNLDFGEVIDASKKYKLDDSYKSEVILKLKEIIPDDQIIYILENI